MQLTKQYVLAAQFCDINPIIAGPENLAFSLFSILNVCEKMLNASDNSIRTKVFSDLGYDDSQTSIQLLF